MAGGLLLYKQKYNIMRKQIDVVHNSSRGGWDVKKNTNTRVSKHFDTKENALNWARNQAIKNKSELVPHGKDGKIQNPNSYGKDPCPPRDKKH